MAQDTMTLDEFEAQMRKDLARYGGRDGIQEVAHPCGGGGETYKRWHIFTDTNRYSINVHVHADGRGYLGCLASCRKPRAGEDWHRGSDLADGPLSMGTWHRILADIVSYEMVKVHDPKKALADAAIEPRPEGPWPTAIAAAPPLGSP
jgi:hypothetical protein